MFYLIHGDDERKSEEKFSSLLNQLLTKKTNPTVFRINDENFDPAQFEEFIFGQTLFEQKYIVACRRILENKLACEFIETNLASIAASPHIFVFYEKKLPAGMLKKITNEAEKVQTVTDSKLKKKDLFNVFSLGDALNARDRRKLWLIFTQALHYGLPAEEIFWQFSRAVRNLLLVKKTAKPETLGLHPFVLKKTLQASDKFSIEELTDLSDQLVGLFHQVRNGEREMDIALERFVMEV